MYQNEKKGNSVRVSVDKSAKKYGRLICRVIAGLTAGAFLYGAPAYAAEAAGEVREDNIAATDEYSIADIVITAERIPSRKMDTPAVVNVVTAQDIADNHYNNVSEAVSHLDGVNVDKQQDGTDELTINGDQRVLVLIDGRRVNNDQGAASSRSSASLSMLPSVKNIDRIEVVRGAGSALYGSDAVGGVINIITKKAKTNSTTIDMNTGSWHTNNIEVTTEGSDGKLGWMISGGLHRQGNVSYKYRGKGKKAQHGDSNSNDVSIKLNHQFDKSSSLDFQFAHKTINRWSWESEVTYPPSAYQSQIYNDVSLQYDFKQDQTTPGFLRVFQNYKSMDNFGKFTTKMQGIDYQNGWKLGKNNTLIAGVEYHTSRSSNLTYKYIDKKITNTAVYLQDTIKLGKQWTFIPGVRMDRHNRMGTHWSPKAAINYNANDKTQVFLSWGRVFKAPTADDMYYSGDDGWWVYHGNPNLKPETGYTTTFGISHKFDKTFDMNFSMFYSKLKNSITWVSSDWTNWYAANLDEEKRRGLDISFNKKLNKLWSVEAGYSYLYAKSGISSWGGLENTAGRNNRQPNAYRVGIHFKQGRWKSNLSGKYITGLNTDSFQKRDVMMIDYNLSYDFSKQGTVYFKINNLLNREYSKYPGNVPGLGRFFQLGVTYTF